MTTQQNEEMESQLKNKAKSLLPENLRNFLKVSIDGLTKVQGLNDDLVRRLQIDGSSSIREKDRAACEMVRNSVFLPLINSLPPQKRFLKYLIPHPNMLHLLSWRDAINYAAFMLQQFQQEDDLPNLYQCSLLCGFDNEAVMAMVAERYDMLQQQVCARNFLCFFPPPESDWRMCVVGGASSFESFPPSLLCFSFLTSHVTCH